MAKVIIFGIRDTAELAHFYLTHDSEHEVVAFCVHEAYLDSANFCGLPVVPFEHVETVYPPEKFKFFAPMTAVKMNGARKDVFESAVGKGYEFISYVSSKATVFPGTLIGKNCFILEDNTIQPFTSIGDNVVLWSGNHIGHHSTIQNNVFFTSHVVLSGHCIVEERCFIGVNATIRDYTHLSEGTLVAMGASITKDTQPWGVYMGNPAKLRAKKSYEVY